MKYIEHLLRSAARLSRRVSAPVAAALLLAAGAGTLTAAPFDKDVEFRQPDGTIVKVHGKGDEFSAVFRTLDGYTVVHDPALNAYCFATVDSGGRLVSTGVQMHQGSAAALGLPKGLNMGYEARKQLVAERYQRWEAAMQTKARWEAAKAARRGEVTGQFAPPPTVGVRVGLTLLVDFSDDPSTVPQAEIIGFCNGDNYTGFGNNGSVKSYFYDNSNGKLTYSNVVTIYIRAPQPKTTYNDTTKDAGEQANILIKDVITTMKALPNYDTTILPTFDALTVDGNNEVIACNVFYAGGNGGVWAMGLWPHSWGLYIVGPQELSPGGKKVFRYQITNIGNTLSLGTFCHENGHMLMSYPDLYDYDYDSVGGAGNFCLMGYGGADKNPVQICAYLKYGSGWSTITELDVNSSLFATLSSSGTNFNHFYRFLKPGVNTEYYIVENRQQQGRDASLPGSGVAIWHIDELGDRDNQNLNYNTTHANYEVTLMQADNQWHFQRNMNPGDGFDLFYNGNSSSAYTGMFTDSSTPSARWWDGTASNIKFADFSSNAVDMTFMVGSGSDLLRVHSYQLVDANQNSIIDVNECTDFYVVLTNVSGLNVTGIKATVSTTTPGVSIGQRTAQYPNLPPGTFATNALPFKISTAPEFVCGTPIDVTLLVVADQTSLTNQFRFPTGIAGTPLRFDNFNAYVIPGGDPNGTNSTVTVSNVTFSISKVVVSAHVTHAFDNRLQLLLIGPDGTTNVLSSNNGGNGRDYGLSCFPDSVRTTFDDDALLPITAGGPPFIGSYQPEEPLSVYIGKSGTNANGVWKLQAISESPFDEGAIQCWSLFLTPATCVDGGGECPGADLAIAMVPQPDPVFIGNPLVYQIAVTNHGPSSAQNVVVSQVLPASVTFVSAVPSQGAASQAGGVVTCNLGKLSAGSRATIMVTVLPTVPGLISSSATATSEKPDFDPQNSTVSVLCRVNPPIADMSVGLTGTPNTLVVGGGLTYNVSVTNRGPSSASGVTVTNILPTSVLFLSGQLSQGTLSTSSNVVICSFGGLTNGQVATATLQVTPAAEGNLVATARVVANQPDPFQANNIATALNVVGPATDLSITLRDTPDPVVTGSNFTYTILVTNHGPSAASSVVVNQTLDSSLTVVSTATSQGSVSSSGNNVTATLNGMPKDSSATITVVVSTSVKKTVVSTATVSGGQTDPNTLNNTAQATTSVDLPFVSIVAAGAILEFESFAPANGAVDNGETVTALLSLRNAGNVPNTNLVARLVATNGVALVSSNSVQTYGQLLPSDLPQARRFSFTLSGTNGATVAVPLQLEDGASLSSVVFNFTLPNVRVFSNTNPISIPDSGIAGPYPATINVSGVTGVVGKVTVSLNGLSHTYPEDIDALVTSPTATAKSILMSMAGAPNVVNADVTFDDDAAAPIPDLSGQILSGSYRPASYNPDVALPLPAPPPAYPVTLGTFKSLAPNGTWSLFVADRAAGDAGSVARGWSLALTLLTPVNKVADLRIAGSASSASSLADEAVTITYSITNAGPDAASFVGFTNTVPANASLISFSASQGSLSQNGSLLSGNLGAIPVGSSALVTVTLVPSAAAAGTLQCTASVGAKNETDINLLNNTATVPVTVVLPEADLIISQTATPNPVIVNSNLTLRVGVTNAGPGKALNTFVTNTLPAGVSLNSVFATGGELTVNGNVVVWNVGRLNPNAGAGLRIEVTPGVVGTITNTARAVTASMDPVAANNLSQLPIQVNVPAPLIVAAGAVLTAESATPANGTIDPGEQVTVSLSLYNNGSADAANVTATLAATGGVLSPSGPKTYGPLAHGGAAVAQSFSFTAASDVSVITATLNLQDNGTPLAPVQFQFQVPKVQSYTNTAAITIPLRGAAQPYPSIIQVSGTTGLVSQVGVTLRGINHNFPRDINVLLVNPAGDSVLLMSHVGSGRGLTNVTLSFSDAAAASLPVNSQISSGTYKPTRHAGDVVMPSPAPAAPYGTAMASVAASGANGAWSLYVLDDSNGDAGNIASGWSLTLTTVQAVNPAGDLSVEMVSAPGTIYQGSALTHTITVHNRGPAESSHAVVRHELPAGVSFLYGDASQGLVPTVDNGVVTWNVGALAAGASAQATLRVVPDIGLSFVSAVSVQDDTAADLNLSNNQAQTATTVVSVGPSTLTLSIINGQVNINLTGVNGQSYEIQASGDLTNWQTLTTLQVGSSGVASYTETWSAGTSARLYRAKRVTQ